MSISIDLDCVVFVIDCVSFVIDCVPFVIDCVSFEYTVVGIGLNHILTVKSFSVLFAVASILIATFSVLFRLLAFPITPYSLSIPIGVNVFASSEYDSTIDTVVAGSHAA